MGGLEQGSSMVGSVLSKGLWLQCEVRVETTEGGRKRSQEPIAAVAQIKDHGIQSEVRKRKTNILY